jgi:Recombinase zinc beta ribbon domain
VSEAEWSAVHDRLTGIRAHLDHVTGGRMGARARDVESKYLLSGFARCAACGGTMSAISRQHGKRRVFFYACLAHYKRGAAVCPNGRSVRMEQVDRAVLAALAGDVLTPAVIMAVVDGVLNAFKAPTTGVTAELKRAELKDIDRQIERLTDAIAAGGELPSLL